eukprot:TRINITY_DN4722_c0_g1_i3.p1 TRINITY_DN4722_c0_g1~~TRINITY_DN4722_c0_g1_i3.p1  ORF type:complete len:373 (+),score=52.25 TRINITY_DN4722_c0_g1_i3:55-1173(+)
MLAAVLLTSVLCVTGERHDAVFGALKQGREDNVQRNGAKPLQHTNDVCYPYNGDQMCQESSFSRCPRTFFDSSLFHCNRLLSILGRNKAKGTLTWWTNGNCTRHRTFCHIEHDVHNTQYEDDFFDFSDACSLTTRLEYSYKYSYMDVNSAKTYSSEYHGSAILLPTSEPQVRFSVKDAGQTVYEEKIKVLLFERDDEGKINRAAAGVENIPSSSAGPGFYAQARTTVTQRTDTGTYETINRSPEDFKVSNAKILSGCPEWKEPKSDHKNWHGTVIGVAVGVAVFLAALSVGTHFYLMKRRQHFAAKILEAQEIQVVEATRVPPTREAVQGVPIPAVATASLARADDECCEAAPLPPSAPQMAFQVASPDQQC